MGVRSGIVLSTVISGCGLLTGLDSLTISDAGPDASDSAPPDSESAEVDAATLPETGGLACDYTRDASGCFGAPACAGVCCVQSTTTACSSSAVDCRVTTADVPLVCTNAGGCDSSGGAGICCLSEIVMGPHACPLNLVSGTNTTSSCVSTGGCQSPNLRMCQNDNDCTMPGTCREAVLSTNTTAVFGVCVPF